MISNMPECEFPNDQVVATRVTAANKVMEMLGNTLDRIDRVSSRAITRLEPVCMSPEPRNAEATPPGEPLPPLFDKMRSIIEQIDSRIAWLSDTINRLEV